MDTAVLIEMQSLRRSGASLSAAYANAKAVNLGEPSTRENGKTGVQTSPGQQHASDFGLLSRAGRMPQSRKKRLVFAKSGREPVNLPLVSSNTEMVGSIST